MADSRVTALEFACGTGTFVVEMMQRAIENIGPSSAKIDLMLREHILRNVYAFEYLIAPYTIAHLKVSQYLEERQIRISEDERFNIYLTNTLEPIDPQPDYFVPALSDETKRATKVKKKPILVITGNPPYAGESKNKGPWITHAIEEYKFLTFHDESGLLTRAPVREKNLKWLHDDYVKFIRFAQIKMDATSEGVVGVITNHSYLDNPTFAGMRNSLMQTFDQIWIVDFHGSVKPKELAPDGMSDENVFDIQKGVAVAFFVKKAGTLKGVWRTDVWGERIEKYKFAASARVGELSWTKLNPQFPDYIFIVQDRGLQAEYERGVFVTDILVQHSVGIVTARDSLAIHFDRETLLETVKRFAALPVEEARKRFKLRKDVRDWKVEWAQADLISHGPNPEGATQILYRPFDVRWTYYTGDSRGFHCYPRHDVMRHLLKDNIALITSRMTKGEQFAHVQVTDKPAEVICMSPETSNNGFVFPLYLYAPPAGETLSLPDLFGNGNPFAGRDRIENVAPKFRAWLNSRYDKIFTVEEIFGFVYAILHCRIYRKRYGEFMRRSFPRIPFPTARDDFEKLSKLGWDLAQWHLFKGDFDRKLGGYHGSGNNKVERVRYSENNQSIYINDDQRFANVPRDVWEYYVGGYQVLDRFLRYRQNRQLSLAEISNVELTVNILASSLEQMDRIDEVYRAGF